MKSSLFMDIKLTFFYTLQVPDCDHTCWYLSDDVAENFSTNFKGVYAHCAGTLNCFVDVLADRVAGGNKPWPKLLTPPEKT